ncbi:MAG TPA: hypothetical protein VKY74_26045 [Chloroflexia bacterium]|nr:hypothetical protein [Chloroflexia bacterium]
MASLDRRMVAVAATVGGMLICLLVLLPEVAEASFCSPHGDSLQNAPIVFSGRAVSVKLAIHDPSGALVNKLVPNAAVDQIVQFTVRDVWRGGVGAAVVVRSGDWASRDCGVGNCGYTFAADKSYLVFAYQGDWGGPAPAGYTYAVTPSAPVVTDKCSRTELLSQASADLAALGPGRVPVTGAGPSGAREGLIPLALVALTAVALGVMLRRRAW